MTAVVIISHPDYALHRTGEDHPERPERINAILHALSEKNLLGPAGILEPQPASEEMLFLCHTKEYVNLVKDEVATLKEMKLQTICVPLSTGDVMICSDSYYCARLAVGGALLGVDTVFSKKNTPRAFCAVRPPGHHATKDRGMGFCLFNNAAIAARYAQTRYQLARVAIVDWDVHHGNGTQAIFQEDLSVLYISLHESPLYPFTGDKTEARGEKATVNCPIQATSRAPEELLYAFKEKVLPALDDFKPELILISCGFDAHKLDPLGNLGLSDEEYSLMTAGLVHSAKKHCEGRIVSLLEGGYNLQALASASVAHIRALSQ